MPDKTSAATVPIFSKYMRAPAQRMLCEVELPIQLFKIWRGVSIADTTPLPAAPNCRGWGNRSAQDAHNRGNLHQEPIR